MIDYDKLTVEITKLLDTVLPKDEVCIVVLRNKQNVISVISNTSDEFMEETLEMAAKSIEVPADKVEDLVAKYNN